MKRRNQVNGWLERVEALEKQVDGVLSKGEQEVGNKCLGSCCPKNCWSSYKIGKNVVKMIPRVTKLTEEGQFDVVADELPPPPVDELLVENLASLRSAMVKLKNLREDVIKTVREAEEQHMERTNQVNGWLSNVEAAEKDSEELGNRCVGSGSTKNCRLLEEVKRMVRQVTTLTEEGRFDVVAHRLPPPTVDEQPMDNIVVGFESKFEEVWQSVHSEHSTIIGLVGMGGVGKTTLLKQLNNEFLKATHAYDMVIWIVVSKPTNLGNIRGALRNKLNIPDHMWGSTSEDQKNSLIFSKLKKKKFVVLLDDMWEGLELSEVGIPRPSIDNMSKVVFTTRSLEVCRSMDAYKVIQVSCLPPDEAFSLFYSKLGGGILKSHPELQGLITDVVSECEGLPLALIIIGRAMRGKTSARQWKEAKRTLQKYLSTFPGMQKGVFSKLVFSYDSLPTPMVKKCLEYCSLYPEDHDIIEDEVIKLWIAEGYIGEYDSMYDALIQGRQIMESLKQACLLETSENILTFDSPKETIKMHDVIRDMALWIACERGQKRNKFHVQVADEHRNDTIVVASPTANAEKISLRGIGITTKSLAGMSVCPNLDTLIIQRTMVEELPGEILHSTNELKVLDLSHNWGFLRLPIENDCLANLEYLNIAWTKVRMPTEISQWKRLRFLIVDEELIIPKEIISSICSLQMFEQLSMTTLVTVPTRSERLSMERGMLEGLEGLQHIMDLRLSLKSTEGIEILLDTPKLQRCSRLVVKDVESLPDVLDFGTETLTKHLEMLLVDRCSMSEIKLGRPSLGSNLHQVSLYRCLELRNLNSLIYVPNLCILDVWWCFSMEELIGEETRSSNVGTSLFSSLTYLTLSYMPKLRCICPQEALPFPSLKSMLVGECENLVKLPFDANTARTTPPELCIMGETDWWDGLEWDSQATKHAFTPKFVMPE